MALDANTLSELYLIICSHWQNPNKVVKKSNRQINIFEEKNIEISNLNNHQKMMALDLINYLPNDILVKIDRAAMKSSLETRVPFLDHELVEHICKIPHNSKFKNGEGKWILRQILNEYVPKNLIQREKRGFSIPLDTWLRGPLRDWSENLLSEKRLSQEGYFDTKIVRNKWLEHLSCKRNWQHKLWNILMFQAWTESNF